MLQRGKKYTNNLYNLRKKKKKKRNRVLDRSDGLSYKPLITIIRLCKRALVRRHWVNCVKTDRKTVL